MIPRYVSLLLFSFFLTHILIVVFPYHLADPRLPLTLSRLLVSPLVCPVAESRYSECTVSKVAVRETGFPSDDAAAASLAPGVTVAAVVGPSEEVAGASKDTALVLPSLHRLASPSAPLATGGQRFSLDVRLSSVLMSCFFLSFFVQSFSQDHTGFFFSS